MSAFVFTSNIAYLFHSNKYQTKNVVGLSGKNLHTLRFEIGHISFPLDLFLVFYISEEATPAIRSYNEHTSNEKETCYEYYCHEEV